MSRVTYLLPIRLESGPPSEELTRYLRWVAGRADLVIVDGSPRAVFDQNRDAWDVFALHAAPDPGYRSLNGKAWGVLSGVRLAEQEIVVIADDDVRYDGGSFRAIVDAMCTADLVRPQNVFEPMPWHGLWDSGRSLLNRAFGCDHPGTLAIRRSTFLRVGGYDGNVLFENLELVRTFRAAGARVIDRPDIYVRRLPPDVDRFWSQRVRQAYDDLAEPHRLLRHLAVIPALIAFRRRPEALATGLALVVGVAEVGRRRAGGRRQFPAVATLFAIPWLVERGVCSWLALGSRVCLGGRPYAGVMIVRAATGGRALRRRLGHSLETPSTSGM